MTDKQRFFALAPTDRDRIGYLIAIMSIVHIAQFAIAPPNKVFGRWAMIAVNALGAFWSIRPERGPNLWFGLLPYFWWMTAIFDGREIIRALQAGGIVNLTGLSSLINVSLLPFLAGPLLRFHRVPSVAKPEGDTTEVVD